MHVSMCPERTIQKPGMSKKQVEYKTSHELLMNYFKSSNNTQREPKMVIRIMFGTSSNKCAGHFQDIRLKQAQNFGS